MFFTVLYSPVKALAYSQLARQRLLLAEKFTSRYPHYWLVWEPGVLAIPRSNVSTVATAPPKVQKGATPVPAAGDPLCFVLQAKPDGSATSIGRAEGNDLVLSDESVSRNHCTLSHEATGWVVACRDEASAGLKINGEKLKAGASVALVSGQRIELGNVVLTFMGPAALATRLQATPP